MNAPDFFKPEIITLKDCATLEATAYDKNAVEVTIRLGCRLSGHAQPDNQMIETMRQQAWQTVWLTAQTDSTTNVNSLFTPQPSEHPIFSESEPDPQP